jgi:TPP-dependent pyruvate/acetoin dehydrogenase alpha subunit
LIVVTRDLDGGFVNLQRQGDLALFPSYRGQDAAQIGASACLGKAHWLVPQYRELGVFTLRGIPPGNIGAAWRGGRHGDLEFTKKCCAPMSIPIGTHGLHAVGAAMVAQRLGEDSVAVAHLSDGVSEGDVHAALNFAAVFKEPYIFYVQSNPEQAAGGIVHRAQGGWVRDAWHSRGRQRSVGLLRGDGGRTTRSGGRQRGCRAADDDANLPIRQLHR